jgi:pimeloyl-ACP methyl ester carboxylesterase
MTLLIGAGDALAAELIRAKLAQNNGPLHVCARDEETAHALRQMFGTAANLTIQAGVAAIPAQTGRKLWLFLSAEAAHALASGNAGGAATAAVQEALAQQGSTLEQVWIVSHAHHLPLSISLATGLQTIGQTLAGWLPPACQCQSICLQGEALGEVQGEGGGGASLVAAGAERRDSPLLTTLHTLQDTVHAVLRRADQYFSRYPLQLVGDGSIRLHLFQAAPMAAALLAMEALPSGLPQLWQGGLSCSASDLLHRIVGLCQHKILLGSAKTALGLDSVSSALAQELNLLAKSFRLAVDAPEAGVQVLSHAAGLAELPELDGLITHLARIAEARNLAMRRSFAELPGVTSHSTTRPGLRYFRFGQGEQVLLIVNAFGLALDFWQMLAAALGPQYRVLALESSEHTSGQTTIPELYYRSEHYVQDYLDDIAAMTAAEGIEQFHLLSWCSGAKLAMELVSARPQAVKSLCMITPSFAGMEGVAGNDSGYEKNLHTMCKLVNQMPKTAPNMANSMMAIMKKNANDLERFQKGIKDAVDILGLVDEVHLPLLYQAFSNGDNLLAYSRQLMRFRAHDIRPCLDSSAMQLPILLITGQVDATTSSERARDICKKLPQAIGFELQGGSHYLLHQNFQLVAALLSGFIGQGLKLEMPNPRLKRSLLQQTG